jgi:hypothetical protein
MKMAGAVPLRASEDSSIVFAELPALAFRLKQKRGEHEI